jgi:uncharacterized protein YjbJ (UPF0337 family)
MDKDRIKGKVKEISGHMERRAGELTGDEKAQARGTSRQVEGKLQNAAGKIKDATKPKKKKAA